jgi:microcystin-dependent protein
MRLLLYVRATRGAAQWKQILLPTSVGAVPTATLSPFAGASAPSGWLLCNGAAVSRSTYSDLFAVIGTTFGAGNGSTTFNLPDMRDRIPGGAGSTYTLGHFSGTSSVTLTLSELPSHNHNYNAGSHDHSFSFFAGTFVTSTNASTSNFDVNGGSTAIAVTSVSDNTSSVSGSGTTGTAGVSGTTDPTGSGASFSIIPPLLGVNFIIKI